MPMLIDCIDQIARNKQRDVIYVMFGEPGYTSREDFELLEDWEHCEVRQYLLRWFEENGIAAVPCGGFSSDGWIEGYFGHLYLDVPYDSNNADYQKLENLLEHEDGSTKLPGVMFCCLPLAVAMECEDGEEDKC